MQIGQTTCLVSSPYCQNHLMHFWWLTIKLVPILSKDILSSATAIMSECIENGISKLKSKFLCQIGKKCAKRKVKRYIENNLSVQAQVKRLTSKQLWETKDEMLTDDGQLHRIWKHRRWVNLFLLIFRPKFLWFLISMEFCTRIINKKEGTKVQ